MDKYFPKTWAVIFATLFLSCACATPTGESQETGKCEVIPPTEVVACTMQWDPVCGCDGKTYGNACMARGAGVSHNTPGACEEKSNN